MRRPRLARREKPPRRREDPDLRRHPVQHHKRPGPAPARRRFPARSIRPTIPPSRAASGPFSKHSATTVHSSRPPCADSMSTRPSACSNKPASPTKVEANGKIFPVSDKAAQVLDALVQRVERSGAELRCSTPVRGNRSIGNRRRPEPAARRAIPGRDNHRAACDPRRRRLLIPGLRNHRRRLLDRAAVRPHNHRAPARLWFRCESMPTGSPACAA